jgi:hypothetical protein
MSGATIQRSIIPAGTSAREQGRVVKWDDAKGYGWIEVGGQRVFAHIKEFGEILPARFSVRRERGRESFPGRWAKSPRGAVLPRSLSSSRPAPGSWPETMGRQNARNRAREELER